ncbi:MAG: hypothetical protein HDT28_00600 [Clostridiales bacterium]|nr:hypothetical protein [Clostridiales bacterium]
MDLNYVENDTDVSAPNKEYALRGVLNAMSSGKIGPMSLKLDLDIGYARAALIIDKLNDNGVIRYNAENPEDARYDIIVSKDELADKIEKIFQ